MALLKTDYKDDILSESSAKRKYNLETNSDGTVSFNDVTEYQQTGDTFGATDINKTNEMVNKMAEVANKSLQIVSFDASTGELVTKSVE